MNRMRCSASFLGLTLLAATAGVALGQPGDFDRPPRGGPEGRPPREGRPLLDPLRAALDTNGDRRIDEEEIAAASSSLRKLDRNDDGVIDAEEMRPPMPPRGGRGPGRPRADRGPRDSVGEGGPSPERFVERAMAYDEDDDGKLDRGELTRFAEEMAGRLRERFGRGRADESL